MALPAATIAEGPLGLEGIHTLGAHLGSVTLNNRSVDPRTSARIILDEIVGLHAAPDGDENFSPRTGRSGERVLRAASRGKTVVYSGRIQAPSLPSLRTRATLLRSVAQQVGERSRQVSVKIEPPAARGGASFLYNAQVTALEMGDEQRRGPTAQPTEWQREFSLGLRIPDPRFWINHPSEQTRNGNADDTSVNVTVEGNAPADPIFTLKPPFAAWSHVYNHTLNPTGLGFARLTLKLEGIGENVRVDFRDRTIRGVSSGSRYMGAYTPGASQWWDLLVPGLIPGTNQIGADGTNGWDLRWGRRGW